MAEVIDRPYKDMSDNDLLAQYRHYYNEAINKSHLRKAEMTMLYIRKYESLSAELKSRVESQLKDK